MRRIVALLTAMTVCVAAWAASVDADVEQAQALAQRLSPRLAQKVEFVKLKAPRKGTDVYSLAQRDDRVVVGGNNACAMAVGLNRYLNHYCYTTVSWYADVPVSLPDTLPDVGDGERVTSTVPQRFFLNYCTYGYTMTFWQWRDWERFIDWMALNGVNMPLAITGQEAVWMKVWTQLGMTPDECREYFTGPSYLPWHRMANVDKWCGPLPQHWIDSQVELQHKILERERALNMRPVMNAFAGHVPRRIKELYPDARISMLSDWAKFDDEQRTYFLDSEDPMFDRIQQLFITEQTRLFGSDHIYGIDPFNEMEPPSWDEDYLARVTSHMYKSLRHADPKAEWLQMGWILYYQKEWTDTRTRAMLTAVPKGKMTILDYFCENREVWRTRDKFSGQPYIWCYLGNFGGNTVFEGNPKTACERIDAALKEGGDNLVGIGSTLEGFDVQQLPYEMVLAKAWNTVADSAATTTDIAYRHAGHPSENARQAWDVLYNDVYTLRPGTRGEMVSLRPLMNKEIYKTKYKINTEGLLKAWSLLTKQDDGHSDALTIDIIVTGRETLNQLFVIEKKAFEKAFEQKDLAAMRRHATAMRQLLTDIDGLNAFHPHCTLKAWLDQARDYGDTPELKDYYEMNALTLITTWGGSLNDYANRCYNGLVSQYHARRWEMWLNRAFDCVNNNQEWDDDAWLQQVIAFEKNFKFDHTAPAPLSPDTDDIYTYCQMLLLKWQARLPALIPNGE